MNTYDWFNIYNTETFDAEGLVSKELELTLEGYDTKTILITKGRNYNVTIEGVFLSLGLNDKNPFEFEDYACYLDEENNIWVGILVPEEE